MQKSQKGFTIIEVALVLAIGALIFLVVLLAVPALQRNQRNDARKRDVSNIVRAVTDYSSNNPNTPYYTASGYSSPMINESTRKGNADNPLGQYIDTVSSNIEQIEIRAAGSYGKISDTYYLKDGKPSKITVLHGVSCDGTSSIKRASQRSSAVVAGVETATGSVPYCMDAN